VLPGTDTLQPLASVTGLVRSAASARAEVSSPATTESSGRRRGGRGGRGGRSAEPIEPAAGGLPSLELSPPSDLAESGFVAEPVSRRQDPELVAVPMEADQELVYGWLGLNPALLLDPPPSGDQLIVRVVRPGEDPDAVLEAARQQQSASGSRRRRRGGRGGQEAPANSRPAADEAPTFITPDEETEVLVEITPLPLQFDDLRPIVTTVIEAPVVQVPLTRKVTRTRSSSNTESESAASRSPAPTVEAAAAAFPSNGNHAVAVVEPPVEPEREGEPGEPRRRRRRSSASA
jgi:ribonuclease E